MRLFRFSACVPPQWSTTAADYLHQLEEGNAVSFYKAVMDPLIWNALLHILRNSGLGHAWDKNSDCSCMSRAEIETVYRIENTRLWRRYKARLAAMRQDHAASKVSVVSADLDLDGCGNFLGGYQWTLDCGKALAMDLRWKKIVARYVLGQRTFHCPRGVWPPNLRACFLWCWCLLRMCSLQESSIHLPPAQKMLWVQSHQNVDHCPGCAGWCLHCNRNEEEWEKAATQKRFLRHVWLYYGKAWHDQGSSQPAENSPRVCNFW